MKQFTLAIITVLLLCCAGLFAMPEPERLPIAEQPEVACRLGLFTNVRAGNGLFGIRGRVRGRIQARQAARAARWAAR